jgi:hypothetical protein
MNTNLTEGDKILTLSSGSYNIQLQQGKLTITTGSDIDISSKGTLNLSGETVNINAQNSINIGALNVGISGTALVTVDFPGKTPTFPM